MRRARRRLQRARLDRRVVHRRCRRCRRQRRHADDRAVLGVEQLHARRHAVHVAAVVDRQRQRLACLVARHDAGVPRADGALDARRLVLLQRSDGRQVVAHHDAERIAERRLDLALPHAPQRHQCLLRVADARLGVVAVRRAVEADAQPGHDRRHAERRGDVRLGHAHQRIERQLGHRHADARHRHALLEHGDAAALVAAVALVPLPLHAPDGRVVEDRADRCGQHHARHGVIFQERPDVAHRLVGGIDLGGDGDERRQRDPRLLEVDARPADLDHVLDRHRQLGAVGVDVVVPRDPHPRVGIRRRDRHHLPGVVRPQLDRDAAAVAHHVDVRAAADRGIHGEQRPELALAVHGVRPGQQPGQRRAAHLLALRVVAAHRRLDEIEGERRDAGEHRRVAPIPVAGQRAPRWLEDRRIEPSRHDAEATGAQQPPRQTVAHSRCDGHHRTP